MSGALLQILGFVAVLVLFATVLLRPNGVLLAVLAIGFVIAGIAVSWRDVEQYRVKRAAAHELTTAFVPSPPREYPRSGS